MLRRAAMEDRTVIMTSVNEAWAAEGSLLDSFLESFRVGLNISHLVKHIVVVAMDEGALRRCRAVHPHCHLLLPDVDGLDLSGAKSYMTKDYLDLVWSKLRLQHRVLLLGYNLLFTARRLVANACVRLVDPLLRVCDLGSGLGTRFVRMQLG
ncbi:uncharacterized protein At4g15970-like [Triticum aestivum]|uniref:uncharacterized protein At4g15970-like n=1 Tax=Triticum aestivum TaxID=4565 RepID=UPI001D00AE4A|nr:uncharacterized protein At4g15970-like [Triticum aestivum]